LPSIIRIELIWHARDFRHRRRTPIVMLSGSDIEPEARRAGADAFLKKPEDMLAIAVTIARLLASKRKE
jgi:CheY-like chemotaxis protein